MDRIEKALKNIDQADRSVTVNKKISHLLNAAYQLLIEAAGDTNMLVGQSIRLRKHRTGKKYGDFFGFLDTVIKKLERVKRYYEQELL